MYAATAVHPDCFFVRIADILPNDKKRRKMVVEFKKKKFVKNL
jgi:hypothetical protein